LIQDFFFSGLVRKGVAQIVEERERMISVEHRISSTAVMASLFPREWIAAKLDVDVLLTPAWTILSETE
jgi:hypothetical protein